MNAALHTGGLTRLKSRSQFLAVARGQRARMSAFILQARARGRRDGTSGPGVGFTVTKRCGNAPMRNRIKRRLRAATEQVNNFRSAHDYVLIGRRGALHEPFGALVGELTRALSRVHRRLEEQHNPPKQQTDRA